MQPRDEDKSRAITVDRVSEYSMLLENNPEHDANFKMVGYRWVLLILFGLYLFSCALNMMYVQPVAKSMFNGFGASNSKVNLSITFYSIANVCNCFFSIYLVEKVGVRWSLTVALFLTAAGNGLNLLIKIDFLLITIGQFVAGLGLPIFFACQGEICNRWFNLKARPVIVALTSVFNPVGGMFGFLLPTFFISVSEDTPAEDIRSQTVTYTIFLMSLFSGFTLVNILLFRDSPEDLRKLADGQKSKPKKPVS
jgi:hypothetical protein